MMTTQETTLDGMTFTVSQLPAMRAMKLLHRLGRAVGPALTKAAGSVGGGVSKMDVSQLGGAVEALFENLSEAEFEAIMRELLATAMCNGTPLMPVFDDRMQGRIGTVFKLLKFALEVNYGSFFADALAGGKLLLAKGEASEASKVS